MSARSTLRSIANKAKKVNLVKFGMNMKFLMKNDIEDVIVRLKDEALEEAIIELEQDKELIPMLNVLSPVDTLELLLREPKSFARVGDGEITLMKGGSIAFQRYDVRLADEMREILAHRRDDLYVGLNGSYWTSAFVYGERNHRFYRLRSGEYRKFFNEHCDPDGKYLDAACFGAYFRYRDDFDYAGHYARVRRLFEGRKVAIVSGEGVVEKLEYDVFDGAAERIVIHGPARNAFDSREEIVRKVTDKVGTDWLICLILGPTATVLASDFAKLGYTAWDLGHIAKDYDAYMKGMEKSERNMNAFWAPD